MMANYYYIDIQDMAVNLEGAGHEVEQLRIKEQMEENIQRLEQEHVQENAGQQMNFNGLREEVKPNRIAEARLQPHDEVPHQVSAEAHRNIDLT